MAQENVEIARRFAGGLIGRDLVPVFADESQRAALAASLQTLLHPDYQFFAHTEGMALLDNEYRGQREALNGFMAGWREFLSAWDSFVIELEEIRELPDGRVLLLTRTRGRSKAAGVEVEGVHGNICTVRDGKLFRFEQFVDRNEALNAAGVTRFADS
jgi:ketosteroid isomerase-like protein